MLALAGAAASPGEAVATQCAAAPPFHPGPLGALAYVHAAKLHVVEVASGKDRALFVVPRRLVRLYAPPQWSQDARWIALGDTLAPSGGGSPCTPFGRGVTLAWAPQGHLLAAVTNRGGLLLGGPGHATRRLLPNGWGAGGPVFDPRGKRVAVLRGSTAFIGSIWVVDRRTARRVKVYTSPSEHVGPPFNASWSRDGGWLLFQTDTDRSASLAADGLPLWAVRASGGRAWQIEREVLVARDFVGPCGRGVVVSAGLGRYVTENKHVDLASPPAWQPRDLSADASRSWYSAACSPDGRLVAATVTANRGEGRFDTAERSIWLLRTDGKGRRLLVGKPGDRISDEFPRWSHDGRWVLYVEHRARPYAAASVYLISVRTGRRRGPIAHIRGGLGYYGYHDWAALASWYQP